MTRLANKTCGLLCLTLLGLMAGGCDTTADLIDARVGEQPPDELVALLDNPKRLVRIFSYELTIDPEEADDAAFEIIKTWNMLAGSSTYWPDLSYFQMKGTRYTYKNVYLYQIYSPMRVLPMAILVPKIQGIVVIVNQYDSAPFYKDWQPFPGIPWDFDHLETE